MLNVGDMVKVVGLFQDNFPATYEITEVVVHEDGQIAYILGELGGFDPKYLEVV